MGSMNDGPTSPEAPEPAPDPRTAPTTPGPADPPAPEPIEPATAALAVSVHEIERHVSSGGWDGPVRVFALVGTAAALDADPGLATQLPPSVVAAAQDDEHHLTSVEQEELPQVSSLEELLGVLSWPETVDGAAVVVERIVLPSAAEDDMPEDQDEALRYLMEHPDRQDVRIAVGVLRSGPVWSAVRSRAHDEDSAVAGAPDLVPGLAEAVRATFL
jgi:hypothetical protein